MTTFFKDFATLVETIGDEAMAAIRLSNSAVSVCTVAGSHNAFRERCSVLLSDIELADLLKLVSEVDCAHWQMPEHAGTLSRAVRFAVIDQIDAAFRERRIDFCFDWADGHLFKTLELAAGAARKVVSVRQSRDVASAGESLVRFLTRAHHMRAVPDIEDFQRMLVSRSVMFRPVVNDQRADWTELRDKGVDKPYLLELMARLANYASLYNENRKRFIELVRRETMPGQSI